MRLRTVRPGVVVGEVALYTGVSRTADVVADTDSVVLRLSREAIDRVESEDPELAAALHRWLARTLAERLSDTSRGLAALD
jgi:SulP family sulfate permease